MAEIVLRVRLIGGEHLDVTYQEDEGTPDQAADRVISALAEDSGLLRCRHGGRLIVLYSRGVATVEVAPRGAVLLRPGTGLGGASTACPQRGRTCSACGPLSPRTAVYSTRWLSCRLR
jgi:hypothetical protein